MESLLSGAIITGWQSNPFSILLIVGSLILVIVAYLAWRRRTVTGAKVFTLLILAIAEWTIAYGFELGSTLFSFKIFWSEVQFLGIAVLPLAWLILTLQYSGAQKLLTYRNLILLTIEPIILLVMVLTNDSHGLIWSRIKFINIDSFLMLQKTLGIGLLIHIIYSYLLLLTGVVILLRVLMRASALYRKQVGSLLVCVLIPWVANASPLFGFHIFANLDLTPFAFVLTGPVIAFTLFGFQFLNIVPVAYSAVLESMSDSVIVIDTNNNIIDLNPAAQNVFGRKASEVIGKPVNFLFAVWNELINKNSDLPLADGEIVINEAEKPRNYDVRISLLKDHRDRLTGKLVVLRDITELKNSERLQNELAALHRITNKIIQAMALIVEMKDPYTAGHERRVAKLAKAIALKKGLSAEQVEVIQIAATIHDIGKINVPADILSKPGQLSNIEYSLIKTSSSSSL